MRRFAATQRAADTRRFYAYHTHTGFNTRATRRRSAAYLQRLLIRVWEQDGRAGWSCPLIWFCPPGQSWSYFTHGVDNDGDRVITLAHHQYDINTLLHEVVHAKGIPTHGPRFVAEYVRLMAKYAGENEAEMVLDMSAYGIQLN